MYQNSAYELHLKYCPTSNALECGQTPTSASTSHYMHLRANYSPFDARPDLPCKGTNAPNFNSLRLSTLALKIGKKYMYASNSISVKFILYFFPLDLRHALQPDPVLDLDLDCRCHESQTETTQHKTRRVLEW
jgi:hypothetical protein